MKNRYHPKLKYIVSAMAIAGLSACSSDSSSPSPDDGGGIIIGTGGIIEGTTTSNKLYASNTVEVRASSGQRSTVNFGAQGQFRFESDEGAAPWLLRTDLGNGNYLYGIAADASAESQIQNIHSYSDAIVRNWYVSRGLDIDAEFASGGALTTMPSLVETIEIHDTLLNVLEDVADNYGVAGLNLNTTEFAANGTGIDQFILQNPVIRNENTITVTIFDPDNNTASVAVEDYELSDDLTVADAVAPTSPTELRALPSASDEITLVWKVASDNVGIARYSISRDGLEIATSPYPVFVDGGLVGTTTYEYNVVALDAAGNESTASLTVRAAPLGATDVVPPPTPSSVSIDTRRGSLDLEWSQTDIGDVASYAISRGNQPTNLPPFVNVNSTFFFDEAINAGEQYCYQISAVDASGNASVPTGVSCATAPGSVVSGGSGGGPGPLPPVDPIEGLTAPQVDVSSVACTNEIEEAGIETAVTLSAGCYVALNGINVLEPGNLTLEPGVIIKFGARRNLRVNQGASLTARGTADNPIVLSGLDASAGHWNGVEFSYSNSANNILDHVQVEYAGNEANNTGAIRFTTNSRSPARVALSNSTLRFNAGPGISMPEFIELSSFDGNRITGNAISVFTHGARVNLLDNRSSYQGNTLDAIYVERSELESNITWPNLSVPYHVNPLVVEAEFTIAAGNELLFENNADITVTPEGTLIAAGTAQAPITFAALSGRKGGWSGIDLSYTNNDNQLRHVTVQHAGTNNREDAAIGTLANSGNMTRLSLDNVTITDSAGFGLGTDYYTVIPEFENVTITGNDGLASMDMYAAQVFNNAGNFTGNTEDAIVLKNADIDEGAITLSNADIPYHAGDIRIDDQLVLEEGVTLSMVASATFLVTDDGALTANGTASSPVSIIGRQSLPGFWNGISFQYSSSPLNRLSHTLLADGGDGAGGLDKAANARFLCNSSNPSRLTLVSSRIENSAGYGIHIDGDGCIVNVDADTTFSDNALGATN